MPSTCRMFVRLPGLIVTGATLAACASATPSTATGTPPAADARQAAFSTWLSPIYGVTPDLMRPDGKTMINGLMPMNPDNQS
jgi:hypothetical protein